MTCDLPPSTRSVRVTGYREKLEDALMFVLDVKTAEGLDRPYVEITPTWMHHSGCAAADQALYTIIVHGEIKAVTNVEETAT